MGTSNDSQLPGRSKADEGINGDTTPSSSESELESESEELERSGEERQEKEPWLSNDVNHDVQSLSTRSGCGGEYDGVPDRVYSDRGNVDSRGRMSHWGSLSTAL